MLEEENKFEKQYRFIEPYLYWKIITNSVRQKNEYPIGMQNIIYDVKNRGYFIDDFKELNFINKTEFYLFNLKDILENNLINELIIRVVDDNNLYDKDNNLINKLLDIKIDTEFIKKHNYFFPISCFNKTKLEKNYNNFIKGFFSIKETLIVNHYLEKASEIKENYHIYFLYKFNNIKNIKLALQNYLFKWKDDGLNHKGNHIKPNKQVEYFSNYLINYINNYGDNFLYKIGTLKELDEIILILYFNILGYIELSKFDTGLSSINLGEIRPITFKIKILKKFYNTFTKKEGLDFNDKTGDVIIDGEKIGNISIETQPYYFFKFLYNNRGNYKTHKEIKEYIKGKEKIEKTDSSFCSEVKNEIKDKKIKKLIKASKGHYRIP